MNGCLLAILQEKKSKSWIGKLHQGQDRVDGTDLMGANMSLTPGEASAESDHRAVPNSSSTTAAHPSSPSLPATVGDMPRRARME
jgi:hypothetical protein